MIMRETIHELTAYTHHQFHKVESLDFPRLKRITADALMCERTHAARARRVRFYGSATPSSRKSVRKCGTDWHTRSHPGKYRGVVTRFRVPPFSKGLPHGCRMVEDARICILSAFLKIFSRGKFSSKSRRVCAFMCEKRLRKIKKDGRWKPLLRSGYRKWLIRIGERVAKSTPDS